MTQTVRLHPQSRAFLDEFAASGIKMPWETASPAEAREALLALQVEPEHPIPVARVEQRVAKTDNGDVVVRIFTPRGDGPFPVLLWFHGGGWVVGTLDESDAVCRSLCTRLGAIVVCPEYRLAPEHRFPAAAEDCYAVTNWAAEEHESLAGRGNGIVVAGDSAGGNLAAAVSLMARDRGVPSLQAQVLVYPVLGLPSDGRGSYDRFAEGYYLTRAGMEWFTELYAGSEDDLANPYFSPLRANDLSGLPPALVLTAECDPLCDEGEEYARRLSAAGTPCTYRCFDGMIHAFFILLDAFDAAFEAHDEVARQVDRLLAPATAPAA